MLLCLLDHQGLGWKGYCRLSNLTSIPGCSKPHPAWLGQCQGSRGSHRAEFLPNLPSNPALCQFKAIPPCPFCREPTRIMLEMVKSSTLGFSGREFIFAFNLERKTSWLEFCSLSGCYLGRKLFFKGALCSWSAAENTGEP